ncbi:MAG TPA: adenylate/guanylate cyclase domain-containing protein [Acidimicrobiia bacterium]
MAGGPVRKKSLDQPDDSIVLPGIEEHWVDLAGYTVGRTVQAPGWSWSRDLAPLVGLDWCEVHHIGVVVSGRWGFRLRDGSAFEMGPGDVYDCPPGHDGYTIGDEPCEMIEWSGLRAFAESYGGSSRRALLTIAFTDLVGSTRAVANLGDLVWAERLRDHLAKADAGLERTGGRQLKTTGDGLLAVFDSPAQALLWATAFVTQARADDMPTRVGIHTGEVETISDEVHGLAVHEAARVMQQADAYEVLVSEITQALTLSSGFTFEDAGVFELKGLDGKRRLFRLTGRERTGHHLPTS